MLLLARCSLEAAAECAAPATDPDVLAQRGDLLEHGPAEGALEAARRRRVHAPVALERRGRDEPPVARATHQRLLVVGHV